MPTNEITQEFVIIVGPSMSGKTLNQNALKLHFECDHVADCSQRDIILNTEGRILVLWNSEMTQSLQVRRRLCAASRIDIKEAARMLGELWLEPRQEGSTPPAKKKAKLSKKKRIKKAQQIILHVCELREVSFEQILSPDDGDSNTVTARNIIIFLLSDFADASEIGGLIGKRPSNTIWIAKTRITESIHRDDEANNQIRLMCDQFKIHQELIHPKSNS